LALALLLAWAPPGLASAAPTAISPQDAERIGKLLWHNECAGTVEGLTSWNQGEDFASLGIGHFIWYPEGRRGPFEESFPGLVAFIQSQGAKVPEWLLRAPHCPWLDRESFLADRQSERMVSLRHFLRDTVGHQARFAARRLEQALPRMLESVPAGRRDHVTTQFQRLSSHPHGLYCLVDYVNFKGEGIKPTERYQGQGWGLLQVLDLMEGSAPGPPALQAFSASATEVLRRRVRLSPPERHEKRWLPGWENRCRTYLPPRD
jgi:hypothetical protein